jgi:N-methylhydantoinase A
MTDTRLGIDTGGTFTDFVALRDGRFTVHKAPSTPGDPARAVLEGCGAILSGGRAGRVIHGSTVATNALLERRGARTALLTTAGFEDVLEIGRQTRPRIYDIDVDRPPPLVAREDRHGLRERTGPFGEVETAVDPEEVRRVAALLRDRGIEAVAVCLLNAYANPENERRVGEVLAEAGPWPVSISSRILPEYREYERCSTTVINAYVSTLMADYLARLEGGIGPDALRVMQSNGGMISAGRAAAEPVRTILSGPAGGVIGALETARAAGREEIITFDMGGTSTDVSLGGGEIRITTEAEIGGLPVRVPVIDIHTVGAGGGSIAWVDGGGALRVGPMSAGADPGPICYGTGTEPTVTDAHVLLGRLEGRWFLDGGIELDGERVEAAIARLARRIGRTPAEAALGIIEVANANMERAIRVISLERGHDPRDFTLVTFGGAGALHACEIAERLSIPEVLVPPDPGALSAKGMLLSDVVTDHSDGVLAAWEEWSAGLGARTFARLEARAEEALRGELGPEEPRTLVRSLDMRYAGQSYELNVPGTADALEAFHRLHRQRYGYADPARAVEVVTARVRGIGRTARPDLAVGETSGEDPSAARIGEKAVLFREGPAPTGLYRREALRPGNRIVGPAVVGEYTATTLIPPGFTARVDGFGNLRITPAGAGEAG